MKKQSRIASVLLAFFLTVGGLALMVMLVYVAGNSVGRALFRSPLMGTIEITGLAGVVVVSVAIAFVEREKSNVVVDAVTATLPRRARRLLDAAMLLLSLGAVAFLLYAVVRDAFASLAAREPTLTLSVPIGPFKLVWAAGLFGSWLFMLKHFIEAVREGVSR